MSANAIQCPRCMKHYDTIHTCTPTTWFRQMEVGFARYEKLRKLNVPEFQKLYVEAMNGEKSFDQLVDELP